MPPEPYWDEPEGLAWEAPTKFCCADCPVLAPTKLLEVRACPPTPLALFRVGVPVPLLWPRALSGLLLPKALLVPAEVPLPVVRLPNMPDELVP
jgi:hypothetical protein